jgi:hypothetical protein
VAEKLRDLQRQIDALRGAASLRNGAISGGQGLAVDPGGVVQSSDFDGDAATNDAGTTGWQLAHGNAAFGSITLRDGIIGDDALQNPVTGGVAPSDFQGAFATTTTLTDKASTSITIPAGFTSALVLATATVVYQDTAPNRFDCRCTINGNAGPTIINLANLTACSSAFHERSLTGLTPGGSITLTVQVRSAVAASNSANQAYISGLAVFTR